MTALLSTQNDHQEQHKAVLTEQLHVLSDNWMAEIAVHTKQILALSDKQMAEIDHLRVMFQNHRKLQNQTMERELTAAW